MPETTAVVPLHEATLPSGKRTAARLHARVTPGSTPGTVESARALFIELQVDSSVPGARSSLLIDPGDAPDLLDALHAALLAMPLPLTGQGSAESLPSEPIGRQSMAGEPPPMNPVRTGDPQIDAAWDLVDEQNRLDYEASLNRGARRTTN